MGHSVTITLTLLQEPEFHGEDKSNTCSNKWQTPAMLVCDIKASPQTEKWTEDSGDREKTVWKWGVVFQITSTNLKPFHRESNKETTDGGLCYTHANTHSQALQNPSKRDDS